MKFSFQKIVISFALGCVLFGLNIFSQTDKPQIAKNVTPPTEKTEPTVTESESSTTPAPASSILHRVGTDPSQSKSLSLSEAIQKALENNNNIEIARTDVKLAETQLRSLLGTYDMVFTISPTYNNNVQPQPSTLGGADLSGVTRSNSFSVDTNLTKFLRKGGGNYSVFFDNSRNSTSSTFSQLNPTFSTNLGVSFNQPLWRNRTVDTTRRQIKIQRKRLEQSDADFRRQTIEVISQVQRAYWDLVFALRDQQNKVANLNLSKENLRQVEAKIAAGKSAPLEKAEVSAELANREADVLISAQQVSVAENTLKTLLLKETTDAAWTQAIIPTDQPVFSLTPISLDDAMKDAMDNRPELRRLNLQKEINKIDIDYFKNQTKPQIDLNTSFTLIGLSGASQNTGGTIPPQFIGGYFQSLGNLFKTDTRTFSVGATISFPLRNERAKADLAGAEVQKNQIEAQARSQEQLIMAEVRNAVQAVETARQRVLAARRGRENAEIQLNGERKLYEVGRSTTFLLFQRENALTNARNAEIRAETDYNKALSDLQKATSTTFRSNNIEIESPMKEPK
jgi:HAE1 family hydrophobic/amphiphilic exporter-1